MKGLLRFLRVIITMRLAVLLVFQISVGTPANCPCNGVVVEQSDQKHCWEVVTREAATWVDADIACQAVGGHLGHPQGTWSDTIYRYVRSSYTKPVLTGIVAGSAEANLYAMVCPNNKFYGLLPKNTSFYKEATNTDTCTYFTTQSEKLTFASCTLDAHALCDRPMEKADYCNIVITCTTTTTTTTTTSPSTNRTTTKSTSLASTETNATNLTTSTNATMTTTTTKPAQENILTNFTSTTRSSSTSTTSSSATPNLVTNSSNFTTSTKSAITNITTAKPMDAATNSTSSTTSTTTSTTRILVNSTSSNSTTSSTPSGAVIPVEKAASCTKQGCGEHEWSIFGWCTDWRSLLLLAALLLALFLLICLLHCCCKLCIDPCQVKRKKEEKLVKNETAKDPPVPKPKPSVKKISEETFPRNSCYDVDQSSSILPPPATITQPVFVPVPVHSSEDGAFKKAEPEIRFISPPKPDTVDVGVNTDPWPLEKESTAKKLNKSDKVQVRRAPTVHAPLVEVDDYSADDPADDVSLHMEQWHSAERQPNSETVLPKGDIADSTPFVFMQNPKPRRSHSDEPKTASAPQAVSEHKDKHEKIEPPLESEPISNPPAEKKPLRGSRSFRSPPPSRRIVPTQALRFDRSPLRDNKMNEQRRIPSPPKRAENTEPLKRDAPRSQDSDNSKPYNGGGANPPTKNDTVTRPKEKRPPASPGKIAEEGRRKPSNDTKDMIPSDHGSSGHEDSAKKARSRREALFPSQHFIIPASRSRHRPLRSREERPVMIPNNHHFAPISSSILLSDSSSAGGTTWRSTSSRNVSDQGSPTLPRGHVSMRNPRGRMGGVVRAGGGGGETPVGWKPWSKASSSLSQKQQFLVDD